MEKPRVFADLGVVLNVNAGTSAWNYLIADLKEQEINPIDVSTAHATLIDTDEIEFEITSAKDLEAVNQARLAANEYLTSLCVQREVLTPAHERVKPFCFNRRRVGIIIAEQDLLSDLRSDLTDIYREEAGIVVDNKRDPYIGHVTLGSKTTEFRARMKTEQGAGLVLPASPKLFVVTGFKVAEKVLEVVHPPKKPSNDLPPKYYNNPASLRRAS